MSSLSTLKMDSKSTGSVLFGAGEGGGALPYMSYRYVRCEGYGFQAV